MDLLAAFAGAWPDEAMAEEAREIVDDLRAVMPMLKTVSQRSPAELMKLSASEAAGDIAAAAGIHDLAAKAVSDLSRRVASGTPGDWPLPTEIAELRLLQSGIWAWIEPTEENEALSASDGRDYAQALLQQIDTAKTIGQPFRVDDRGRQVAKTPEDKQTEIDGLVADFEAYVAQLVSDDSQVLLAAAIRAIDELAPARDKPAEQHTAVERMAIQLSAGLGDMVTRALSRTPQLKRTRTERTPNDILMHLMTAVRGVAQDHPDDPGLKDLQRRGRTMFMTHTADRAAVSQMLEEAGSLFETLEPEASATIPFLKGQLPAAAEVQPRTQLHDNLYGRVFETKFAKALVEQPPEEFFDICQEVGGAFGDLLDLGDEASFAAAIKVAKIYSADTPRPWQMGVPDMADLAEVAKQESDQDVDAGSTLEAVKAIFDIMPETGQEIVARLSLMAELSAQLVLERRRLEKPEPEWMVPANRKYADVIRPQRPRDWSWPDGETPDTDAVGITLLHHPAAAQDTEPVASVRSATYYRFGKRSENTEIDEMESTTAIRTAHEKGLPFGTGISGCANMLLHLFHHLKKTGAVSSDVDPRNFVMMASMLVAYDGGHSLHEVLWVANLLDRDLDLGLDIGDPDDPTTFVADYDAFFRTFDGDAALAINEAADTAWDGTQDYLEQHSVFAAVGPETAVPGR